MGRELDDFGRRFWLFLVGVWNRIIFVGGYRG